MKFKITQFHPKKDICLDISEREYNEISSSKEALIEILFLEQKFDIVLENFLEFEMELLKLSNNNMVYRDLEYGKFQNEINTINRRVINLLTACRLYIDHSKHHLSKIYQEDSDIPDKIKNEFSIQYESVFGYRVLEALRNYVQHRGFPIHSCSYNSKWVGEITESDSKLLHAVTPYIDVYKLREDGKFKKETLNEMEDLGEKHDIKPLVRGYISSISKVHNNLRTLISQDKENWESIIHQNITSFKVAHGIDGVVFGLTAIKIDENADCSSSVYFSTNLIEHRVKLERKNQRHVALESSYVSSEVIVK